MKNQNLMENKTPNGIDTNRRKFLTVILIGSGAFFVEKFLTPLFSRFLNDSPTPAKTVLSDKTDFENFKVVENKKILSIYDSSGEEIFQIDKEG